jgi:hypothetical protein
MPDQKVVAVTTLLNEEDIIEHSFRHMLAEGIDEIYVAHGPSTDSTLEKIDPERWSRPIIVVDDPSPYHYQPKWISELSRMAGEAGAEWIIPFDADEFWYSLSGDSVASELRSLPSQVRRVAATQMRHLTWGQRFTELGTLPKIAFRYEPKVWVANGNHECTVRGETAANVIAIREICYRGLDHFMRKTRERNATIDPALPTGEGAHQRQYNGMSDTQLRAAWKQYRAQPHTYDPVPSRIAGRPWFPW